MAYTFTVTESIGIPEQVTFTDTSDSSLAGMTERRVYIRLANGNWLTTAGESSTIVYEVWSIGDTSLTLTLLSRSTAASITVNWMTNSTITATTTETVAFVEFDYLFAYDLIGSETSSPGITQDNNYYSNFIQFIVNLFNGENAISTGGDIYSSQQQLNKNYVMEQNQQMFF